MLTVHTPSTQRRWQHVAAVLLVGALGLQVMPVQLLYSPSSAHHACAERGFCPRNPEGPCRCTHHGPAADHHHAGASESHEHGSHEHDAPSPTMQACGGPADTPLLANGLVKGVFVAAYVIPAPKHEGQWGPPADLLVPQPRGADIFRPPKAHLG